MACTKTMDSLLSNDDREEEARHRANELKYQSCQISILISRIK